MNQLRDSSTVEIAGPITHPLVRMPRDRASLQCLLPPAFVRHLPARLHGLAGLLFSNLLSCGQHKFFWPDGVVK